MAVFAALFDFEALRQGKIAIVEPILGFELPITVGLSLALAGESLSALQLLLIAVVFVGIMLSVTAHHSHLHYKRIIEKGVIFAGIGAVGMGLINFLVGVASQEISPLLTVWFVHSLVAIFCLVYMLYKGICKELLTDFLKNPKIIAGQSLLDNMAWITYAKSTTYIPIAVATTISESYIALAVLLGLFLNNEKLSKHQIVGVAIATVGVIVLSYYS